MKTIYDAEGVAKTVEPVDAREHIATGQWFSSPPEKPEAKPKAVKAAVPTEN